MIATERVDGCAQKSFVGVVVVHHCLSYSWRDTAVESIGRWHLRLSDLVCSGWVWDVQSRRSLRLKPSSSMKD